MKCFQPSQTQYLLKPLRTVLEPQTSAIPLVGPKKTIVGQSGANASCPIDVSLDGFAYEGGVFAWVEVIKCFKTNKL